MPGIRRRLSPSRRFAFHALKRIELEGAYSSYIAASPEFQSLEMRDRNLAFEIVLGTLRRRGTLDRILTEYRAQSLDSLDPKLLLLLRMGSYQLIFLDRIPAYAVLSESVELCREVIGHRPAGLLNAILRNVQRDLANWKGKLSRFPEQEAEQAAWLSLPEWLWRRWILRFGTEAAKEWAAANNLPPRIDFRIAFASPEDKNKLQALANQGMVLGSRILPGCYSLKQPHRLSDLAPEWIQEMHIQSLASQYIGWSVPLEAGDTVLDLCAAPGGKTLILAERTGPSGRVVAIDRRKNRMKILKDALNQLQVMNTLCVLGDASRPLPFNKKWQRILLDAPCSGLGTIRRNPEIRWRVQPSDLLRLQSLQLDMLRNAAANILPQGTLLYSTCSTEPEENELVVQAFLEEHPDFKLRKLRAFNSRCPFVGGDGFFRSYPNHFEEDGFFAALLVNCDSKAACAAC